MSEQEDPDDGMRREAIHVGIGVAIASVLFAVAWFVVVTKFL